MSRPGPAAKAIAKNPESDPKNCIEAKEQNGFTGNATTQEITL